MHSVTCVDQVNAAGITVAGKGGARARHEEDETTHVRVYVRTKRKLDKLARKGEPYARVIEEAVELLARKGRHG